MAESRLRTMVQKGRSASPWSLGVRCKMLLWQIAWACLFRPSPRPLWWWLLRRRVCRRTSWRQAVTFWGGRMRVVLPETVSAAIYRDGIFEAEVAAMLVALLKPGMTFVGIGAHVGALELNCEGLQMISQ